VTGSRFYSRHTASPLFLRILGPVRAFRNGAELDLGSPQQRALLAVLLVNRGMVVPLHNLIDAIWEDRPPQTAIGTVRTYVSRLRTVLGPREIESRAGGYVLRIEPDEFDLAVFQSLVEQARASRATRPEAVPGLLQEALALCHGEPLTGIPGSWAEARRAALTELRISAEIERITAGLECGDEEDLVADLSRMIAEHPLRERPRELLMLALERTGRRAEALESFHEARRLLVDRLGIDPGPGLQQMYRRVLGGSVKQSSTSDRHAPGLMVS
jgi:DNA-binding SARP family transcriptional activator